jgi:DNA-binding transcriptional ArsR family regulator/rhodanese-related sulfurtransferase
MDKLIEIPELDELSRRAGEAVKLLKLLANERRLQLLCLLATHGELSVGALADAIGLSQSALSQHLALLRAEGLVAFRRDGQTIHYAIADAAAERFLVVLKEVYCNTIPSVQRNLAMAMLKPVTPQEATSLLAQNCVLVDVREPHEQAMERIPDSIELPLSVLARGEPANLPAGVTPIFLCAAGSRTRNNSAALAEIAGGTGYELTGGIMAWKRAGLSTDRG